MKLRSLTLAALLASALALPATAQTTQTTPTSPSSTTIPTNPSAATATPGTRMNTIPPNQSATQGKAASLVDINSASEADLDALPGVGKARASAIIKGRPYKGKDDLVSKRVLPKNVYDGIKDKIIARQS